jgi:hypothetical protein
MIPEQPSLQTIDTKLQILIQKVDSIKSCQDDHEQRLRKVEADTIRVTVIFGGTGLLGVIGFIKSLMP